MRISGAEVIVECLIEEGVDRVFGYPGGQVIPLYDALYMAKDRIKHTLTAHEQGASHAADGYARSTGKVGVCIATSGPGATNLVTGLATAYMDSSPVVAITGNVPLSLLGRDSFQEVDITGVTMPITKHNYIVKDKEELASVMREAFRIAKSGRPGPVLVDVPKNIQTDMIDFEPLKKVEEVSLIEPRERDIDEAVGLIKGAKKPFVYYGGGVIASDASSILREFLDMVDAPCCSTLMGLGAVDSASERFTGMVGMHGTKVANSCINSCDLLIVIGARFSDRVIGNVRTFAKQAKILQIDADPAEFNKNVISTNQVAADVKPALAEIMAGLKERQCHKEWMDEVGKMKSRFPMRVSSEAKRPMEILQALDKILSNERESYVTTEVGQHQMWAAQFLNHAEPRHFITSGGLGTMGFGTGAAIGTQFAHPEARVVNVAGDGSFRMNVNELATISRYSLPIVILVFNNHCLGMVRQWQTLFFNKHYSETTLDTPLDWVRLAEAYGCVGMRLGKDGDPEAVLEKAFALRKAVVIDCEIPTDDKVFPMVAPGASISDMMGVIDEG